MCRVGENILFLFISCLNLSFMLFLFPTLRQSLIAVIRDLHPSTPTQVCFKQLFYGIFMSIQVIKFGQELSDNVELCELITVIKVLIYPVLTKLTRQRGSFQSNTVCTCPHSEDRGGLSGQRS